MLTIESRRRDFPGLDSITYLNTAAESIPPRQVTEALTRYAHDKQLGMRGREAHFAELEGCREVCARLLGMAAPEVAFCSCSSEAYNLLASALDLGRMDEVVVNDLDFPAGVTPWLRSPKSPTVRVWTSEKGELNLDSLGSLLHERTRLVQVSLVSFYNGHCLDWTGLHNLVRQRAPQAIISVDITQALGRIPITCQNADIIISSTHKWTLGVHGGCVIGIPKLGANRLTTRAGGWFNLENAFGEDRFHRAEPKSGAASYSVGMPNFAALYALRSSLSYLESIGIPAIARHADPLTKRVYDGLLNMGLIPLAPWDPKRPSGIVAFRHENSAAIHQFFENNNIHIMHNAGRLRISVHGYNAESEVDRFLEVLQKALDD